MTAVPNFFPFPWDKAPPSTPSHAECLQASQLIWSTKPWHSSSKGWHWRPLLDIC